MQIDGLPVAEFGFPGPLRGKLVAAILSGAKSTTSSLATEYQRSGEPLPAPRLAEVVIDSAGRPVAVIETTGVRIVRLADIDLAHALGEGEGYDSLVVAQAFRIVQRLPAT